MRGESTSMGLLAGIQAADERSWQRLRALYEPLVLHWCRKSGLSVHDAEDICQEVFSALMRGLKSYHHQARFRTWLRTITLNKIRDFIRTSQRQPNAVGGSSMAARLEQVAFTDLPPEEASVEESAAEEDIVLGQLLAMLKQVTSPTSWQAFWRTTIDEAPVSVVAQELGISEGAVRQAKYRLLQRLRGELKELEI